MKLHRNTAVFAGLAFGLGGLFMVPAIQAAKADSGEISKLLSDANSEAAKPQLTVSNGKESLGQRLARICKKRGYTQTELAAKIGLIQALVSDYERDKLRMNSDTVLRFAGALEVCTDELLRPAKTPAAGRKPSRKVLRRLELVEL